jgi:hypothetical protein
MEETTYEPWEDNIKMYHRRTVQSKVFTVSERLTTVIMGYKQTPGIRDSSVFILFSTEGGLTVGNVSCQTSKRSITSDVKILN